MRERLEQALNPDVLEIVDESHLHRGHVGARDGRGHFRINTTAAMFADRTRIERHRLIYQALGNLMETDIHALAIEAFASEEL